MGSERDTLIEAAITDMLRSNPDLDSAPLRRALTQSVSAAPPVRVRGRPPKADPDKRIGRLVIMATAAEAETIRALVPAGRDFSAWARERLLGE